MKRVFTVLLALVTGIVLMTSCQTAEAAPHSATPGTYTVTAHGWYGDFPVSVTVSGTAITDISYEGAQEAAYLGGKALPLMVERIKAANTAGVDTVAGATMSSAAFKAAVVEALKQAKASAAFTAAPPKAASRAETLETDLLVIGSGAAGFSAAIAAKEGGVQNVLIIEKNDLIGGSTITSAGIVYAALDEDDIPGMVDYYMGRANQQADRTMLQFFAENSLGTISFLQDHGWVTPFAGSAGTAPESRARFSGGFSGQDLINPLEASAKSLGIVIKTDVTATGLIQANGAIVGAKAVNRAGNISYTINAKAVMLATGGYDASQEMLAQYNPRSAGDITLSNKGNTGDGIRMGVAVGAATVFKGGIIGFEQVDWSLAGGDTGNAMAKTNYIREDGSLVDLNVGSYAMNATDYPIVHTALLRARDEGATKFFTLLDSTPALDPFSGQSGPTPDQSLANVNGQNLFSRGFAFTGDTAAALAAAIGADPSKLEAAIAQAGLITPPYYAVQVQPTSIGSMGGLKTNIRAEVLNTSGTPIPGLYAAGEVANGDFYYQEYPASGSSNSLSFTFGREAGKNAAAYIIQ